MKNKIVGEEEIVREINKERKKESKESKGKIGRGRMIDR